MATVGSVSSEATIPSSGFITRGINQQTQVWSAGFTMPTPGGWVTILHAYFDADVTAGVGDCCMWDSSGNLLASVSVGSVPVGGASAGGQAWHHATLATPVYVVGGSSISLGFFMPSASGFETSSISGGSSSMGNIGASGPASQSGAVSTGIGTLGVFAEFFPNLLKIRRSGAWVEAPLQIRRSGAWVPATPLWIRRSGAWVQIQ